MGQPMIGEIRMFGGSFAPAGWAFCSGQLIPISENDALFVLLGTTYGGDGQETFALPNLQSRIPMHRGTGPDGSTYIAGEMAGTEQETITTQQMPLHNHAAPITNAGGTASPANATFGTSTSSQAGTVAYNADEDPGTNLNPQIITPVGGNQPHENTQPFLCINFIISLYGVFPRFN
jgi:microcystin-dependent protein